MDDDEHRDTPAYRMWEAENARRSAAMSGAHPSIQGKQADQEDDDAEPEPFEEGSVRSLPGQ